MTHSTWLTHTHDTQRSTSSLTLTTHSTWLTYTHDTQRSTSSLTLMTHSTWLTYTWQPSTTLMTAQHLLQTTTIYLQNELTIKEKSYCYSVTAGTITEQTDTQCNHGSILQLFLSLPHQSATTVLRTFFQDHPGEQVPEVNFWTLWCKGRLTEADTPTIGLGATASGLTSAHLHHPIFLQARCPSCHPTNKVKALRATSTFGLGKRR